MMDNPSPKPIMIAPPLAPAMPRSGLKTWITANWLALVITTAILIGATGMRLFTYDRYLPYADYSDETTYAYIWPRMLLGYTDFDHMRTRYGPPPPLYNVLAAGVHLFVDQIKGHDWTLPSQYYHALRALAVAAGIITTGLVISLGWILGGAPAGILAGTVWAFAPIIVDHNSLAIPDPFVYMFTALALVAAVRAWITCSPWWLLASLLAGIGAIYNKYWIITAVLPFLAITAALTSQTPQRMRKWLVLYILIAALSAAYLLGVVNPIGAETGSREINDFRNAGLVFATDPLRLYNNFWHAAYPVGLGLFLSSAAVAALAYLINWRYGGRILNLAHIGLLVLFALGTLVMSASFSNVWLGAGKIRHVLPVTVVLLALWGAALAQIGWTLADRLLPSSSYRQLAAIAPTLILIPLLVSYIPSNIELIRNYSKMHVAEAVWRWTDDNLPDDGRVLGLAYSQTAYLWNRPYTGYDGDRPFEWWTENREQILAQTPEQYANERGISYFIINETDLSTRGSGPAVAAFLDRLTLVKTFAPSQSGIAGPTTYFYRMLPPQVATSADFGTQFRLIGYDLNTATAYPGGELIFRPYWRILATPDTNYSMFLHLYPLNQFDLLTQADGSPTVPNRPTLTWTDIDELYLGWDHTIHLPFDLPPGDYRLAVGLYDPLTGVRLPLPDGMDFFNISVTVRHPLDTLQK